jgi:hypothetical protein
MFSGDRIFRSWNIQDAVMGVFDLSAICKLTCFVDIVFTFEGRRTIVVSMVKAFVQFFSFALAPVAPFTAPTAILEMVL